MDPLEEYVVQSRRDFLASTASGIGTLALTALLQQEGVLAAEPAFTNPLAPKAPHFAPKAKNCIFLFMAGAPSQLDLFDPKPKLNELDGQKLPPGKRGKSFWKARYRDINAFERHLADNGTVIRKFFLHISKEEQRKRFLERIENPDKHWKFSAGDLTERGYWDDYQKAFEEALSETSTKWAPWYVVPADSKWIARAIVADVVTTAVRSLDLEYPEVTDEKRERIARAREQLLAEGDG